MRKTSLSRDHHKPATAFTNHNNNNTPLVRPNYKSSLDNSFSNHQYIPYIYDQAMTPVHVRQDPFLRNKAQEQMTHLRKIVKPVSQSTKTPTPKDISFNRKESINSASGTKKHNSRKNNLSCVIDNHSVDIMDPRERRTSSINQHRNLDQPPMNRDARVVQIREVYSNKGPGHVNANNGSVNGSSNHRRINSSITGYNSIKNNRNTSNMSVLLNSSHIVNGDRPSFTHMGNNNYYTNNNNQSAMHMYNKSGSLLHNGSHLQDTIVQDDYLVLKDISNMHDNINEYSQFVSQGQINALNSSNLHLEELGNELEESEHLLQNQFEDQSPNHLVFDEGKKLYKMRDYKKAIILLKESLNSEDKTAECLYLLGVCYLWVGKHTEAIQELTTLLDKHSVFHKNIFLLISIAYKKLGNNIMAIRMLSKAISHFPKYYDAYIYRGKLFVKEKHWEKALHDFQGAIHVNPKKGLGYIGKGDCLRMMGSYEDAAHNYSVAISLEENLASIALLKRGITYIELKAYSDALNDFEQLIEIDHEHSEAYYFKGLVLQKTKCYNDAILCYEQSIKHNNSRKAVIKSLYEIAKIKIETKDFYEAYYTLHRADLMELEQKALMRFKVFTEGVIYLMKRKHDEGVDCLTSVLKKQGVSDFLKPLVFEYRAYGLICTGKIKKALQDYQELANHKKLDKAAIYNQHICEGILASELEDFENAAENFEQAHALSKDKMEPYFYKACLLVNIFCKNYPKTATQKLNFVMTNALKELNRAQALNDSCSNLYYIRSLLFYAIESHSDSLIEIEKAIEKSDENYPKYFFLRALNYSALASYEHAVSDFCITLNLDKNFSAAYLERGKCYFAVGDLKMSFMDIQKYISEKPNDPNIHLLAGNLLFNTGAFEDAAKAYSNSENIAKNEALLQLRAKCYIVLKELNAALIDLNKLAEISNEKESVIADRNCLQSLKSASGAFSDMNEGIADKEKLTASLLKVSKLMEINGHGLIFRKYDFMFYKGVLQFYLGEYKSAIKAWDFAKKLKDQFKEEIIKEKVLQRGIDPEEDKLEMIKILEEFCSDGENEDNWFEDESNTCFNDKEIHYNKALAWLKMGEIESTMKELALLEDFASFEERQKITYFVSKLHDERQDQGSNGEEEKIETFELFSSENRLCSIFSSFRIELSRNHKMVCRLSFCLPYVAPPTMSPTLNLDILEEINVTSVESRPEAPWIKRTSEGVQFTENLLEKEESEIVNLKQLLADHNLRDDILDTLLKSEDTKRSAQQSHKEIIDSAVMLDDEHNVAFRNDSKDSSTEESVFPDVKLKKSYT